MYGSFSEDSCLEDQEWHFIQARGLVIEFESAECNAQSGQIYEYYKRIGGYSIKHEARSKDTRIVRQI